MLKLIFDSNSLITGCKCRIHDTPIINYFLGKCKIFIPDAVKVEVVDAGSAYIDSAYAKTLMEKGNISIKSVSEASNDILLHYKLGNGEREAIMINLSSREEFDYFVTDDRLAFVVCDRLQIKKILFIDLIVEFVKRKFLEITIAKEIVKALESRYQKGFIYHTLKILETEDQNEAS